MAVILAHIGADSLVDYQHYVWPNMFQFLGAQVATIPLKSVCSTGTVNRYMPDHPMCSKFNQDI